MRLIYAIVLLLVSVTTESAGIEVRHVYGPEDPGGRYKHPSSMTQLVNGDLYLAFYGGSGEYARDTAVYGGRLKAGADQWTRPAVIADTPRVSEGNPVVWQAPDGIVWLFYVVRYGATWSTSRVQAKISRDGAQTWSDPMVLTFKEGMMVRGRPLVLANGDYLVPIYHEAGHDTEAVGADSTSLMLLYDHRGQQWSESTRIHSPRGNIQPAVVGLSDQHLLAYCRRGGGYGPGTSGHIVRSESLDGGRTWSEGRETQLPNPNAAVDLLRLTSGNLLLAYNHSMTARDPLAVALSTDEGKTFPHRVNIAEGGTRDFAYPYLIQTRDDKIHLVFTSNGRSVVNHAVFDERDILGAPPLFDNTKNPQAVADVLAGRSTVANAAWWGFDRQDSTEALQAAINSGARKVVVPSMGADWVVRPIRLAGNQELVFEEGVVISAKRGEYRGRGDCVLTASDVSNLTIRGYGATVRMQKEDYIVGDVLKNLGWNRWFGQYEKAEWRTALSLRGCRNVTVRGLTLRDSGGDGIYIDGAGKRACCRDIRLKDVLCDNNYRQGISIISVDGLLVEDCRFNNTWGTPPSSGVDIEPDSPEQKVKNIVFRNCRFEDNYGDGVEVFLAHQRRTSDPVSVRFEDCHVSSRRGAGIRVTKLGDNGPQGLIEFRNCTVEKTEGYGIKVQDKSAAAARVRFVRCTLRNVANNRGYHDTWTPICLHPFRRGPPPKQGASQFAFAKFGGIDFVDCQVHDDYDRAVVMTDPQRRDNPLFDIKGTILVDNPHGVQVGLGENRHDVTIKVEAHAAQVKRKRPGT